MARNDYMFEEDSGEFFQVEYNLHAASTGSLCQGSRKVHQILNAMTGRPHGNPKNLENTPEFVKALKIGFEAYGNPDAIILVLTDNGSNIFDQICYLDELALQGYFDFF